MSTLAISSANLSTLESNMNVLNSNINSVSQDVVNINGRIDTVDKSVSNMQSSINSLEAEIRAFLREIKGNTLVSNAQNDIIIKQNELARKYGYYDNVRRQGIGLVQNIDKNKIYRRNVINLKDTIIINTPNYYLSYAICAICYWLLNMKNEANVYLNKALRLNEAKTSLLMALVHLKLKRNATALKWIKKYLSIQKPTEVSNDFICVIEALANNSYNSTMTKEVCDLISEWSNTLNNEKSIYEANVERWRSFFDKDVERVDLNQYPLLNKFTENYEPLIKQLERANSYKKVYDAFDELFHNTKFEKQKEFDDLLNSLINNYENEELKLKKDILKDNLIIKYKGDSIQAENEFSTSSLSYEKQTDFYTLLTNTLLERNDVSPVTRKLAVSFLKDVLNESFTSSVGDLSNNTNINLKIDEWSASTTNGSNEKELINSVNSYASIPYDKELRAASYVNVKTILCSIFVIIGIVLAFYIFFLGVAIMLVALGLNFYFIYEVIKTKNDIELEKQRGLKVYQDIVLCTVSEIVDVNFEIERAKKKRQEIIDYINSFNSDNYINLRGDNYE